MVLGKKKVTRMKTEKVVLIKKKPGGGGTHL